MQLMPMLGSQLHVGAVWGSDNDTHIRTRWAPTSFIWSYNHHKQPCKWVIGVKTPIYKWSYNPTYNLSGAHFV